MISEIFEKIGETTGGQFGSFASFLTKIDVLGLSIAGLAKNLITSQKYSWSRKIPTTTLEEGVQINNRIIAEPLTIEQSFVITGLSSNLDTYVTTTVALQALLWLRDSKNTTTTLVTHNGIFPNMEIVSCIIEQNNPNLLTCLLKFQSLTFAPKTQYGVSAAEPIKSVKSKAPVINKAAKIPLKTSTTPEIVDDRSALQKIIQRKG